MSEKTRILAEKIAGMISGDESNAATGALDELNERLTRIEKLLEAKFSQPKFTPAAFHPSQEKFNVAEAVAGLLEKDKICTFEPGRKPCDHCSMCGSRGF